jgi:hypothetical protein
MFNGTNAITMNYIFFMQVYGIITLIFLLVNSAFAGFQGRDWNLTDLKDSILWPLSLSVLFGLLIRIIYDKKGD